MHKVVTIALTIAINYIMKLYIFFLSNYTQITSTNNSDSLKSRLLKTSIYPIIPPFQGPKLHNSEGNRRERLIVSVAISRK